MFASGLSGLFESLDMNEDCYGVGYLSKLIASELASMPSARMRRKVCLKFSNKTMEKAITVILLLYKCLTLK